MSPQGGEKTEKPTPKRRHDARQKGQVFKSADLTTAVSLLVVFGALSIFGTYIANGLQKMMISFFSMGRQIPETVNVASAKIMFTSAIMQMGTLMLPILAAAMLAALVMNYAQVGFIFSSKAASPQLSRLNFIEGFKRMFSKRTLIELVKTIIKLIVVGIVAFNEYQAQLIKFPQLMGGSLYSSILACMQILLSVGFQIILVLVIMAPFDYLYQWWKYRKDLMMTKQEVRDESRLMEGNPEIKSQIRAKQRQMGMRRIMQAVLKADVVITNPTHYAIAIEYKEGEHEAPVILAKGKDYMALRIKEKAKEHNITIVENKPVAQQLYFFCEIGDEVPEQLYQAVAEILAYVYKLKQNLKGGR